MRVQTGITFQARGRYFVRATATGYKYVGYSMRKNHESFVFKALCLMQILNINKVRRWAP